MAKLHKPRPKPVEVKAAESERENEFPVVEKPLKYFGLEHVLPLHSDVAAVRHTEHAFQLLFFQVITPIGTKDDQKALEELEAIPAHCIGKIILTPQQMLDLYNAMGVNITRWQELVRQRRSEMERILAEQKNQEEKK